jgi:hypothetical protein
MLPNVRLMARAFHRVPVSVPVSVSVHAARRLSNSNPQLKWEGRQAEENTVREKDTHNAQIDASREGKEARANDKGDAGTSEKAGGASSEDLNKKAEKDRPEAPQPVIGMNDERGGVSISLSWL